MESAKAAASQFLNKSGHHDSTVHERVSPSVTNEHVTPTRHENVTTAVDKEIHQDHHHTTVLPVSHQEVLPEKHSHKMAGVEHRTFDHGDHDRTKSTLETERAQYKDTSTTHSTKRTEAAAPQLEGEHVHHHVHETVQPVVHKETIAPSVVHTTVPIHETHHNEARHHETTTLPTMTMDEFKKHGSSLGGKEENHAKYDGCPDPSNPSVFNSGKGLHLDGKHGDRGTDMSSTNQGPHASNMGNKLDPRVDSDADGRGTHGMGNVSTNTTQGSVIGNNTDSRVGGDLDRHGHPGTTRSNVDNAAGGLSAASTGTRHEGTDGAIGTHSGTHSHGIQDLSKTTRGADGVLRTEQPQAQHSGAGYGTTDDQSTATGGAAYKKPSLIDRLNPTKDSDGDGKKGFMK